MADRPSKLYVADALEAFREFCEKQNQKLAAARAKATRTTGAATASKSRAAVPAPESGAGSTPSVPTQLTSDPINDVD